MKKSLLNMSYNELDILLDSLLDSENLPKTISYKDDTINYYRYSRPRLILKALFRIIEIEFFYHSNIKKRVSHFKNMDLSDSLKELIFTLKLILPDLLRRVGGTFDIKIFANYMISAILYDASCDIPKFRRYLTDFDAAIMSNKPIESKDEYLVLFNESTNYIKKNVDNDIFDTFTTYMQIEHISQIMSMYQQSDKPMSKESLLKVTLAKGGIAILACSYIMSPRMNQKEKNAMYEIGGILQIFEDLYDLEEDLKIGIQTLPNQKLIDYNELEQLYNGTVNNLINTFKINPYHPNPALDILSHLIQARFTGNIRKI